MKQNKPDYYLVTYHDAERSGKCFDETKFYNIYLLTQHLEYSIESVANGYCDYTKVWVAHNGELTELCDIR